MDKDSLYRKIGTILIFVFLGVGLLMMLMRNLITTLLWITLIGVVFYLFKYPPNWLLNLTRPGRQPKVSKKKRKRKKYPFRVIDGNKKSS
jgi:hypothetical protein